MIKFPWAKTLWWYIGREFLAALLVSTMACTLFMLIGTFWLTATEFADFNVSIGQVAWLSPFLLPKALGYALPPAAMIAVTMVFGRLSAESEILAAQAGGAPLRTLAYPVIAGGVLLTVVCLLCNSIGMQWGYQTIRGSIKPSSPEFRKYFEREGSSFSQRLDGNSVVRINMLKHTRDPKTGEARHPIQIVYFENDQMGDTILAEHFTYELPGDDSAQSVMTLTLHDVQTIGQRLTFANVYHLGIKLPNLQEKITIGNTRGTKGWHENYMDSDAVQKSLNTRRQFLLSRIADFGSAVTAGSIADPAAPAIATNAWNDMRIHSEAIYGTGGAQDRASADRMEFHRKIALSCLPLSMVVLGIGLGLLVRRSQRLIGFLLGIVVYGIVYYPMMIVTKELSVSSEWGPYLIWLPNIILFSLGSALWYMYEYGLLSSMPLWMESAAKVAWRGLCWIGRVLWTPFAKMRDLRIGLFRRLDNYMASSFIVPFIVVLLVFAFLYTALDLAEHGSDVFNGIVGASEPAARDMEVFTPVQAIWNAFAYYGIRALEITCEILPLMILLAGALAISAAIRNQEHIILKSAGVSLRRAIAPILFFALVFSFGVLALRETVLPEWTIKREYLRPYVYHRTAAPAALALNTTDVNGSQVLFEMSRYQSTSRSGKDLQIYQIGNAQNNRIPLVEADEAHWDPLSKSWRLFTRAQEKKSSAEAKMNPYGYSIEPVFEKQPGAPDIVTFKRTELAEWKGNVTPKYIESERLGASVMNLTELQEASHSRPVLKVDMWRRVSEWMMGFLLLCLTLPLLMRGEDRGMIVSVILSVICGAAYWALNLATAGAAREDFLPAWGPLIPHAIFFAAAMWQFWRRMPT